MTIYLKNALQLSYVECTYVWTFFSHFFLLFLAFHTSLIHFFSLFFLHFKNTYKMKRMLMWNALVFFKFCYNSFCIFLKFLKTFLHFFSLSKLLKKWFLTIFNLLTKCIWVHFMWNMLIFTLFFTFFYFFMPFIHLWYTCFHFLYTLKTFFFTFLQFTKCVAIY